ncbi:MAG: cadherin repeat domain-containing protein, partial [Planctomycetaceae bacterium]|nr:cadherin repeat domain-containing protein [Planctomycetaceae bacterium]
TTGDVSILASPDAELKNSYQFDITATDAAGNSSTPHSVLLAVNNLDDTAPAMTSATNIPLDENVPANQIVYTAIADDTADVSNGVTFAISGLDAGSFSIDPTTGEVSILASPDADVKNSYQFEITATDSAGNASEPHTVSLEITNLDDTAPVITSATNITVDENVPPNQIVYTAIADDTADVS